MDANSWAKVDASLLPVRLSYKKVQQETLVTALLSDLVLVSIAEEAGPQLLTSWRPSWCMLNKKHKFILLAFLYLAGKEVRSQGWMGEHINPRNLTHLHNVPRTPDTGQDRNNYGTG